MNHENVAQMFWQGVEERGAQVILRQKQFGIWQAVTWTDLGRAAREVGMGLASLGFEPGEAASIQANTNREWLYADLGVLCAALLDPLPEHLRNIFVVHRRVTSTVISTASSFSSAGARARRPP